jgi:hypothetical protein
MQGVDIKAGGRNKKVHRTAPKSDNPYLKLLVKVCVCVIILWGVCVCVWRLFTVRGPRHNTHLLSSKGSRSSLPIPSLSPAALPIFGSP